MINKEFITENLPHFFMLVICYGLGNKKTKTKQKNRQQTGGTSDGISHVFMKGATHFRFFIFYYFSDIVI